ncbi:MAG: YbbR-like domain-containing protein [Oscillospiraceae bacterium]
MRIIEKLLKNIKENIKTIALAFGISIFTWFFVSIQIFPTIQETIKGVNVEVQPTEYMLLNNLHIKNQADEKVDIRIEGKRYDIADLSEKEFYAIPDLSSIKTSGTYTVPLTVSQKMGAECEIIDTNPKSITLQIDEIVTKEFSVTATAPNISLPEGYYADELTANPATITVTGSSSIIDKISRIEARSSYNGAISESHDTQSELIIYGANGSKIVNDEITLSTKSVSVNIPIYKQKEMPLKFTLANVPSNFDLSSLKYEIQPKSITIAAPDDSIDYISELDIGTVDMSDIKLNQPVYITIALPEGCKNLSGNNNARIIWNIADYGKLDFSVSNINIKNVPENYNVSLITKEVMISVMGPSKELSELTASDFFITADLFGKIQYDGSQDVAVTVQTKGNNNKYWVTGYYKVTIYAEQIPTYEE